MTKNSLLLGLLLIFCLQGNLSAQSEKKPYVIIVFSQAFKISMHAKRAYYWIIPADSLRSENINVSKLYLSGYSKNDLDSCCHKREVDPTTVYSTTSYAFDTSYYKEVDELESLIVKYKKKIQKISKKWEAGQEEKIEVFAIPVLGIFCHSTFGRIGKSRYPYAGDIYLPVSSFSHYPEFWNSSQAKHLSFYDFSQVWFDALP